MTISLDKPKSECTITHMSDRVLSTFDERLRTVIASAVAVFADGGYLGVPVSKVATHAGISTAYVFKLFPTKERLFVAALEECYERILATLADAAADVESRDPDEILDAMGGAYAQLISDRDILKLQVHALSAVDVPAIGDAVRRGTQRVVERVSDLSRANDDAVQRFVANGQLCQLVVMLDLASIDARWAGLVSHGLRHPPPLTT